MECPRCYRETVTGDYEGYPVCRCDKCGGFWVEGGVLRNIIETRKEIMPSEAIEEARKWHSSAIPKRELHDEYQCPACGSTLSRAVYGYDTGVVIDRCPNGCGIWLDKGELIALQSFDEVWDDEARRIFREKGLSRLFENEDHSEDEVKHARAGILGRLSDVLIDFLDRV